MSQTTRYAIELEEGEYYPGLKGGFFADAHLFSHGAAEKLVAELRINRSTPTMDVTYYPHARIVPVKCEVVDD